MSFEQRVLAIIEMLREQSEKTGDPRLRSLLFCAAEIIDEQREWIEAMKDK